MKRIGYVLVGITVVLLVFAFAKDIIVKTSVEKIVSAITGLRLDIRNMQVGVVKTSVGISGLRLFNPEGYEDAVMLNMSQIYVDYNASDMLKGKIHLSKIRIEMEEFVVIKNAKGELNISSLKAIKMQKGDKRPRSERREKPLRLQIDELELKIGKVVYKDYSKGPAAFVREFNIDINERYSNINDPYKLVALIIVKSLARTTIAGLANFDLRGLKQLVSDTIVSTQEIVYENTAEAEQAMRRTQDAARKALEGAEQGTRKAIQETSESLKKTAEDLRKSIELPFGSSR